MSQSLCSSSCASMFRTLPSFPKEVFRQQKMRRRSRHNPIPKEAIGQLKESMKNYIISKIKHEVIQLDKAQAVVHHNNATNSKISDNIRALWRAIMDVEQAMELDDQVEPYAERYSDESATSGLSTLSTCPSSDVYESDIDGSSLPTRATRATLTPSYLILL